MASYTLFEVSEHVVAVEASALGDVLEPAAVTPLPFATDGVEGLVNAAGRVLVQLDLGARALGLAPLGPNDGKLVIAELDGVRHALHVSGVLATIEHEAGDGAEDGAPDASPSSGPRPSARARISEQFEWCGLTVHVARRDRLAFRREDAACPPPAPGLVVAKSAHARERTREAATSVEEAADEWLHVTTGDRDVGIAVSEVREVAEAGSIARVFGAPREVAGIVALRGAPLLVLSLGALLGDARPQRDDAGTLLVLERGEGTVSVLVDRIYGFRRVPRRDLFPVSEASGWPIGYLMLEGKPVPTVSLHERLTAEAEEAVRRFVPATASAGARSVPAVVSKRLLDVRVGESRYLLPIESVERLVEYRAASPLPPCAAGRIDAVLDVEGVTLPVVDLRRRLGHAAVTTPSTAVLVLRALGERWAVVIDQVHRIVSLPEDQIERLEAVATRGIVGAVARLGGEPVAVLSPELIVRARPGRASDEVTAA